MTAPDPDHGPAEHQSPPPGCPAHIAPTGPDGTMRLYSESAQTDPMGLYEELRKQYGAVAPVLLPGDISAWLVLGHRENLDVSRRYTQFSRDSRIWHGWESGRIAPDSPLLPMIGWRPDCVSADGIEHQRLRGAVTDSLSRFDQRGIRRHITRFTHRLVDDFCQDGHADVVSQFAEHLPMLVLTHLLGMPDEYGPRLVAASRDLIKGTATALASNEYVLETLRTLVEQKRANPGHDFASALIAHEANLTDDEVQHHLRLVLLAGYETTTNLIVNTIRMVVTDPRFRGSIAGGQLTLSEAVEQMLWDEPPLMVCPGRWATGDAQLAGQEIRAGDMLLLGLAAGNMDPAVRPDPQAPVHHNRSHLAFSGGPHECPGQDVGRAVTETGIDILLARLPDIRLAVPADQLSWRSSPWSRHLESLPVAFTPAKSKSSSVTATSPLPPQASSAAPAASPAPVTGTPARSAELPALAPQPVPVATPSVPKQSRWELLKRLVRGT